MGQGIAMTTGDSGPPKHILAGDDSPDILALLRDILEGEGYRFSMSDEMLSLAEIKRTAPDLVILDHMFDDGAGSGWELLRDIRRDPELSGLPVVVCTGAVQRVRDQGDELRALGAQLVLKPFDIDQLLGAISSFWSPTATSTTNPAGLRPAPVADRVTGMS
jgi:DNA-binding response OmpR family regulator